MITDGKVTEMFFMADEFCQKFIPIIKISIKAPAGKRKYHRDSTMSEAEIMTILIVFHMSDYRCLKHFYLQFVCVHMQHLFPKVVSYNRFVELERSVAIPLTIFIKKSIVGQMYRYYICR